MRTILKFILSLLARLTLMRYRPRIVGITGSVGKTSTKEAVALVLSKKFHIRQSPENYNNELGLPLAILGESSGNKNPLLWLKVIVSSLFKLAFVPYPGILVLEMGTDRPGDIEYLVDIVKKLDAVVITDIGLSHLEFFTSSAALAKEKLSITKGLSREGMVAGNFDNLQIREGLMSNKHQVMSFGFDSNSLVSASDFQLIDSEGTWGANFKVHHAGTVVPFFLPNALGKPSVYASLAAAAVGLSFGLNLVDVSENLKKFEPLPGRLRLIAGIKQTSIIDDTYNAAPNSTAAGLEALSALARSRKITVLGDMGELGKASEEGHRQVAGKIMELGINAVFLVGEKVKVIQEELMARKFSGPIFIFANADLAGIPIQNFLKPSDTVLVKGSQAMRMEKIVKEIMADPQNAEKLLVRQSERWLEKP